jgi:hypothetical protein|nr:MAG TPA: hypothetical protein [Caudoviricetes sp.]
MWAMQDPLLDTTFTLPETSKHIKYVPVKSDTSSIKVPSSAERLWHGRYRPGQFLFLCGSAGDIPLKRRRKRWI